MSQITFRCIKIMFDKESALDLSPFFYLTSNMDCDIKSIHESLSRSAIERHHFSNTVHFANQEK